MTIFTAAGPGPKPQGPTHPTPSHPAPTGPSRATASTNSPARRDLTSVPGSPSVATSGGPVQPQTFQIGVGRVYDALPAYQH